MKKIVSVLLIMSLMFVVAACGGKAETTPPPTTTGGGAPAQEQSEEKITFKIAHAAAETHPYQIAALKFAELVKAKTNDRIEFEIYPSRQLGDDREILEQTMNGTLDSAIVSSAIFSAFTPVLESLQMPFLINNYDVELKALQSPAAQELLDSLDASLGVKGVAFFEAGIRHIANTKVKVESPEDLKGLKLRVVPSDLIKDTFAAFGASPTPMAYGEVYSALQTKVIDGEEINITSIASEKHYEVLKHVTLAGQFPFPSAVVFNKDLFAKLSPEDQKAIQDAANETRDYILTELKRLDEEAIAMIKEKGVEITELQDNAAFVELMKPIYDKYTAKDPLIKNFVEEVQKLK